MVNIRTKGTNKKKKKLYKKLKYRKDTQSKLFKLYKLYKSKINKLLRKAERDHFLHQFTKYKDNIKKTWGVLKTVINSKKTQSCQTKFTHNDKTISDPKEISNNFNNFFANIGSCLASKIDNTNCSPISFLNSRNNSTFFLTPTNSNEVLKILSKLKPFSTGYDHLSADFLMKIQDLIIPYLVNIINKSFISGVFPRELKLANIIPLFKSGNSALFTNYRPISLLSSFSKVFEKLFYTRLVSFLKIHNIIYKYQFGFREGHSTYMAMTILIDKIINTIENDECAVGVFLDFSKAFDTVNHDILLNKLEWYGVRGSPLKWISSYLEGREQFTTYNGVCSSNHNITCGVPQGSVLGPLLFIIYVNDLAHVSNKLFTLMFADDTSTFITGKNITELCNSLNDELCKIVLWLKSNKLSLNIDKTHFMVFQPRKKYKDNIFDVKLDGKHITRVHFCKFLGVILDDELRWSNHIMYIKNKVSKVIGIMYKARTRLRKDHLLILYNSMILPYLSYCNLSWSSATITNLTPLVTVQKRAIRAICYLSKFESTQTHFDSLGILRINDLRFYTSSVFMYKFHHKLLPPVFDNYFSSNSQIHNYNTRQENLYHTPQYNSATSKAFIKYFGVIVWKKVNTFIDVTLKLSSFKQKLKTYLINQDR